MDRSRPGPSSDFDGGVHVLETVHQLRQDRHVHAPGEDEIAVSVPDHAGPETDRVVS